METAINCSQKNTGRVTFQRKKRAPREDKVLWRGSVFSACYTNHRKYFKGFFSCWVHSDSPLLSLHLTELMSRSGQTWAIFTSCTSVILLERSNVQVMFQLLLIFCCLWNELKIWHSLIWEFWENDKNPDWITLTTVFAQRRLVNERYSTLLLSAVWRGTNAAGRWPHNVTLADCETPTSERN